MAWFKRKTKGIHTSTKEKKDTPEGLWHKTPTGKIIDTEELQNNSFVSPEDGFHIRIGSQEYFNILFDDKFKEIDQNIKSKDPLKFTDKKSYNERVKDARKKTGLKDAIKVAVGKSYGENVVIACMDFKFIGGSMGSVVGEKISRAIDTAIKKNLPLIIISKSGGARMMEGAISLMQMAKTSAKLAQLANNKLPYVSLCTDPTTGGVKVLRHLILIKNGMLEFKRSLHPNAIFHLRHNNSVVEKPIIIHVLAFFILYLILFIIGAGVLSLVGLDFESAIGAAASSIGNVGPALGTLGPLSNFESLPLIGKYWCSFLMLIGRLELFTVLILFTPYFWRDH
ncbi:hypothetical protein N9534_02515 [Flavobacteriaceae bacterium]|nr:hypothetical protein [Flavobacteriaceae bacterium]